MVELLGVAQLVQRYGLEVELLLGRHRQRRPKLKVGLGIKLHINLRHVEDNLAGRCEAALIIAGGAAQHALGQLVGGRVEGNDVLVVVGNAVGGGGGGHVPVHAGLAAPVGQGPLPGRAGRRVGHKVGAEAEAYAAAAIQGHMVGAAHDGAGSAGHVGEGVGNEQGRGAFGGQLVAGRDAHGAAAGRVAVGVAVGGHPHLNAGVGPSQVIGRAGPHPGCPAIVGVLKLDVTIAPAATKTLAFNGEHGPGPGGHLRGRKPANDWCRRARAFIRQRATRQRGGQHGVVPQHPARLPGGGANTLVESRIYRRILPKRLAGAAIGEVVADEALLAAVSGPSGLHGGQAGPGRGHQKENALLARREVQRVG